MITLEQLEKGVELHKQIAVLDVLLSEKRGTFVDIMKRCLTRNSYEQTEIQVLKSLLKEKKEELEELVKKCQKEVI